MMQEHDSTADDTRFDDTVAADGATLGHDRTDQTDQASEDHESPATIGRFEISARLGEGGMGTVYLGHDARLDRKAAIKVLRAGRAGEQARARMLREARALARVSHPNVVQIYESGEFGQDVYIAMEFVDGPTLGEWMKAGSHPVAEICDMFAAAGHGLAAAHAKGLVHRDFKPDNVMIGSDGRVRVMDFGLVRAPDLGEEVPPVMPTKPKPLGIGLTATGEMLGTPAYMAPEQHRAQPTDARTDQFSYCVAFWEALYGQRPFAGATLLELTSNVLAGQVCSPPSEARVNPALRAVILRGLAVDAKERWPSIEALLRAIDETRRSRRRAWIVAFATTVLASLIALLVLQIWPDDDGPAPEHAGARVDGLPDAVTAADLDAFVRSFDIGDYAAAAGQLERVELSAPQSAAAVFWRATFEHTLGNEPGRRDHCMTTVDGAPERGGEQWQGSESWRAMATAACGADYRVSSELLKLLDTSEPSSLPQSWLPLAISQSLIPGIEAAPTLDPRARTQADAVLRRLDEPLTSTEGPALTIRWQLARFELRVALGRFEQAQSVLAQLLTTHPEAPIIQARAAQFHALRGELEQANQWADEVARYDLRPMLRLLLDAGRLDQAAELIKRYATSPGAHPIQHQLLLATWCGYAYRFELQSAPQRCAEVGPGLVHSMWIAARPDDADQRAMSRSERAIVDRQAALNAGGCEPRGPDTSVVVLTVPPFETYLRQLDIYAALCPSGGDPDIALAQQLAAELVAVAPGDPWALLIAAQVDDSALDPAAAIARRHQVLERWRDADDNLPLVDAVRRLVVEPE